MSQYSQALIGLLGGILLITAGCTSYPRYEQDYQTAVKSTETAKKLGTKWGEDVDSSVQTVTATRLTQSPLDTAAIYYRDEAVPHHISSVSSVSLSPIEVKITGDNRHPMPMYNNNQGQYVLPAQEGQRYQLLIKNNDSNRTYEVVTTVDGIDVLNGRVGSYQNNGYLIRPKNEIVIQGFRKSSTQVAAFRFASPEETYANQNVQGNVQNIGVIGIAIFEVREELPDCKATPFPADRQYAPAPCRKR